MRIADPNDRRHLQHWKLGYRTLEEIIALRWRLFLIALLGVLLIVLGLWLG
jgi:hypothetical protein